VSQGSVFSEQADIDLDKIKKFYAGQIVNRIETALVHRAKDVTQAHLITCTPSYHCAAANSASALSNHNPISISRIIATPLVRCALACC